MILIRTGLRNLVAHRFVPVFENAFVKMSGSVANIVRVALVTRKRINDALLVNDYRLYLFCLVNLFQILADEDWNWLHGNAYSKTEIIHLSSNHIC